LERSSPLSIKRGDLAVDDQIFRSQQFQGIDKLRIIFVEVRSVAGEEPYIFTSFDGERPVAIKFHLIEPVAGRKVPDSEGHHWLNEVHCRRRDARMLWRRSCHQGKARRVPADTLAVPSS
jgi:hypothetical protein